MALNILLLINSKKKTRTDTITHIKILSISYISENIGDIGDTISNQGDSIFELKLLFKENTFSAFIIQKKKLTN